MHGLAICNEGHIAPGAEAFVHDDGVAGRGEPTCHASEATGMSQAAGPTLTIFPQ
jgi:hypothetical protein